MTNAFNTETDTTVSALDAYLSNTALDTFDDIRGAWKLAGAEVRDAGRTLSKTGGGALERVLLNAMDLVAQGKITVNDKATGKKPADYQPTHADILVGDYLDSGVSAVARGTTSYRNMLSTVQNVLSYAKNAHQHPVETIQKAFAAARAARAADEKGIEGNLRIMEKIARASRGDKVKHAPLPDAEIATVIRKKAAAAKAFVEYAADFLEKSGKRPDVPVDDADWNEIVEKLTAFVAREKAEEVAEAKAAEFATGAAAMIAGGKAKLNKNGTVTVKLTAEQLASLGITA